jgi:hypothetical protein
MQKQVEGLAADAGGVSVTSLSALKGKRRLGAPLVPLRPDFARRSAALSQTGLFRVGRGKNRPMDNCMRAKRPNQ